MAGTGLKSSLDVDFQQVNTSQALLLQLQAQARLQEAFAELSAALGLGGKVDFTLVPLDLDPLPSTAAGPLIAQAWAHRPDLLSARADRDAALRFAKAETAAHYPVISAQGGLGINPGTENKDLPPDYGAIGVNVSVPVFTGGLLTARAREAALRAEAAAEGSGRYRNRGRARRLQRLGRGEDSLRRHCSQRAVAEERAGGVSIGPEPLPGRCEFHRRTEPGRPPGNPGRDYRRHFALRLSSTPAGT